MLLMVGSSLLYHVADSERHFMRSQDRLMAVSMSDTVAQIHSLIDDRQRRVGLFAEDFTTQLRELAGDPENTALEAGLLASVKRDFPKAAGFTIAGPDAETFLDPFGERIGEICRDDIRLYSTTDSHIPGSTHANRIFVHPQPDNYHFDLMADWMLDDDSTGIILVSFDAALLAEILARHELPDTRLLLLRNDRDDLIEVSSTGSRDHLQRPFLLNREEITRIRNTRAIDGTRWNLVALPDAHLFSGYRNKVRTEAALVMLVVLGVTASMLYLVRHEEQRRTSAEQALARANASLEIRVAERTHELEKSNTDLSQFAYVASHDLQEPLRMVTSYLQLLEQRYRGQLDDKADTYIHYAVDGAHRMKALIQDLLKYSRISSRGLELMPVDLEQVMEQALSDLSIAIRESGAEITRDRMPMVIGDAVQLRQLLENLIGNSLKYRKDGDLCIHIGCRRRQDMWEVSVTDNGIGFEPEAGTRIFEIFQRLHTRDKYSGTGIGLAVCKRVVERHGGHIHAESEPGKGATFSFTLHMAGENATGLQPPEAA